MKELKIIYCIYWIDAIDQIEALNNEIAEYRKTITELKNQLYDLKEEVHVLSSILTGNKIEVFEEGAENIDEISGTPEDN